MKLGYNKNLRLYLRTQYNSNTGRTPRKGTKKNPRGCTEVGTFTSITLRKENVNKPGHAKENLVPSVRRKSSHRYYPKYKKRDTRLPLEP